MKWKVAMLVAGLALGSAGTGLSLTTLGRYQVPRGYGATFVGLPKLLCLNKRLTDAFPAVPQGTVAVLCAQGVGTRPSYTVVFEFNRLSVFSPSNELVFTART